MTPEQWLIWACGFGLGAVVTFVAMLIHGAVYAEKRYDAGWVDRGLHEWRKDKARRNAAGRFRPKHERIARETAQQDFLTPANPAQTAPVQPEFL